jgi:hypothetical protein
MIAPGHELLRTDPRVAKARGLFDAYAATLNLGAGHARPNLRYAIGVAVLDPAETGWGEDYCTGCLARTVSQYIRPQYRDAVLAELERIVRSAKADGTAR